MAKLKTKKKKVKKLRQDVKFVYGVTKAELQKAATRAVQKINNKGGRVEVANLASTGLSATILYIKK